MVLMRNNIKLNGKAIDKNVNYEIKIEKGVGYRNGRDNKAGFISCCVSQSFNF